VTKQDRRIMTVVALIIAGFAASLYPMIPITVSCEVKERHCICYGYEVLNESFAELYSPLLGDFVRSEFTIRNLEEFGGIFRIVHKLYGVNGSSRSLADSFYLGGGQNHTSTVIFTTAEWKKVRYNVSYIEPPDYSNWTRVTEQRTVYVSLVQVLMHLRVRVVYPIIEYQELPSLPQLTTLLRSHARISSTPILADTRVRRTLYSLLLK
jgi:hypothetical protein